MKQKTPVQELIEQLKEAKAKESCASLSIEDGLDRAIEKAEAMLAKEKEQHEVTWNTAHQAGRFEGKGIAEEGFETFENYYNATFNTKEK